MAAETTASELSEEAARTGSAECVASAKKGGRPKKSALAKIDIDDEIAEANRLADISKRVMQAARMAQRNSKRAKQRLVRKAGKLSASDLERIATLKRCGLFVPNLTEQSNSSSSGSAPSSSSGSAPEVSDPARRVNSKLFSVVGQVQGAADLFASMHHQVPGAMSSVDPHRPGASSARASTTGLSRVPVGRPLMPAQASVVMASISEAVSSAAEAPPASPTGQQPSAEADPDDDSM